MVMAAFHKNQEQNFDYSDASKVEEVGQLGKELGFGRANLQNFSRVYSDEELDEFYKKYIANGFSTATT
jgi:hypothetical protein